MICVQNSVRSSAGRKAPFLVLELIELIKDCLCAWHALSSRSLCVSQQAFEVLTDLDRRVTYNQELQAALTAGDDDYTGAPALLSE